VEGSCDAGELLDEPPINVGKSNKPLELGDVLGRGPVRYCFELGRVHPDAVTGNKEAKILNFPLRELAFFRF
jgi:hypothetical protein